MIRVACVAFIFVLLAASLVAPNKGDAETREKVVNSWQEYKGTVQKVMRMNRRKTLAECSVYFFYRSVQRSECNDVRLGGACAIPGANRLPNYSAIVRSCPRFCNSWVVTGTFTERVKELVKDCTPIKYLD